MPSRSQLANSGPSDSGSSDSVAPVSVPGDLNSQLIGTDVWTEDMVVNAGIPIYDVEFITVGGGLGSFAMADHLRIGGLPTSAIRVLAGIDRPEQTYRYLAENSQIPVTERLRSDSSSTIDNIWGFPSYALREAWAKPGLAGKLRPLKQVFVEPVFDDFYTPQAGQVYESVSQEAARIGWPSMVTKGIVRMVRKRHGGGYFVLFTPPDGAAPTKRIAYRCRFVHIAVGYPGVRFLRDLQEYRQTYRDFNRVVNAYEPHDYVYKELLRRPSTVLVRGSGIVASRILQRLISDRDERGAQTEVLHLFRSYISEPQGDKITFRRDGSNGFAYQGFNFPKSSWGGQLKDRLESLSGPDRAELLKHLGGTNTPKRRDWQEQLTRGRAQGFYRQHVGQVTEVRPGPGQTIATSVVDPNNQPFQLEANFIIDATGLESDISEHRLLKDLLDHTGAQRNHSGRLDVDRTFELVGSRNGDGRIYASGSATLGGYYAGVDSFLGLQYAALTIADDLAAAGFGERIGFGKSISEWWKWMRHQPVADQTHTPPNPIPGTVPA